MGDTVTLHLFYIIFLSIVLIDKFVIFANQCLKNITKVKYTHSDTWRNFHFGINNESTVCGGTCGRQKGK
jgi:hypothetical protein